MKTQDIKMGIYKIICVAAKNHGQAFGALSPRFYSPLVPSPLAEVSPIAYGKQVSR